MIMTTEYDQNRPVPPPSTSPPCSRDRLLRNLSKYSPHATQILPTYREFRLGQGDPLIQAAIEHGKVVASGKSPSPDSDEEIHLTGPGTLLGGMGMNDVVHVGNNEVIEFPCLPYEMKQPSDTGGVEEDRKAPPRHRRVKQTSMPAKIDWQRQRHTGAGDDGHDGHPVDHLVQHGTTFAGLGMNDIVHVDKDTVISVPCVPPQLIQQVREARRESEARVRRRHTLPGITTKEKEGRLDHLEDHGSPLAGLGVSDIIHILSGNDQVLVSLPVLPTE